MATGFHRHWADSLAFPTGLLTATTLLSRFAVLPRRNICRHSLRHHQCRHNIWVISVITDTNNYHRRLADYQCQYQYDYYWRYLSLHTIFHYHWDGWRCWLVNILLVAAYWVAFEGYASAFLHWRHYTPEYRGQLVFMPLLALLLFIFRAHHFMLFLQYVTGPDRSSSRLVNANYFSYHYAFLPRRYRAIILFSLRCQYWAIVLFHIVIVIISSLLSHFFTVAAFNNALAITAIIISLINIAAFIYQLGPHHYQWILHAWDNAGPAWLATIITLSPFFSTSFIVIVIIYDYWLTQYVVFYHVNTPQYWACPWHYYYLLLHTTPYFVHWMPPFRHYFTSSLPIDYHCHHYCYAANINNNGSFSSRLVTSQFMSILLLMPLHWLQCH